MTCKTSFFSFSVLPIVLVAAGSFYMIQDGGKKEHGAPPAAPAGAPDFPKPGPEHEMLAKRAGAWDFTAKMTMDPSQPPTAFKGSETVKMMGPFWIVADLDAAFEGMPFQGHGMTGYSPVKKKFITIWTDSAGPDSEIFEGTYDAEKKTLTMFGETPDPMAGNAIVKHKSVLGFKDDNSYTYTMYKIEGGKDVKVLEMEYKRRK